MLFKSICLLATGIGICGFGYADGVNSSFESLIKERHSGRTYDGSKEVSSDQINKIIEAARFTPSCYNDQPWNFIIGNRATHPETYQKIFDTMVEFNQGWAKNAPVLVLAVASTTFSKNDKPNRWGPYDTGAAAISMVYQATALGLMAHEMGGFDEKKAMAAFEIPGGYLPMAVIAIGYEAENAPDKDPKKDRKPVAENFFFNSWKEGK